MWKRLGIVIQMIKIRKLGNVSLIILKFFKIILKFNGIKIEVAIF